jgi:hypothetical protein
MFERLIPVLSSVRQQQKIEIKVPSFGRPISKIESYFLQRFLIVLPLGICRFPVFMQLDKSALQPRPPMPTQLFTTSVQLSLQDAAPAICAENTTAAAMPAAMMNLLRT